MILEALTISLKILGVHVVLSDDEVLGWLKALIETGIEKLVGLKACAVITAPLFNCFVCMSSVWTIIFSWELTWYTPLMMLMVCGINAIIAKNLDIA